MTDVASLKTIMRDGGVDVFTADGAKVATINYILHDRTFIPCMESGINGEPPRPHAFKSLAAAELWVWAMWNEYVVWWRAQP